MATINVAFSSGLESVAMVTKGLRDGHTLNLCVINVSNNRDTFLFELYNTVKFVEYVKENMEALGFKGSIKNIYQSVRCPWAPCQKNSRRLMNHYDDHGDMVVSTITQQFATVVGMLDLRRWNVLSEYPGVWIGWLKQDAAEFSNLEYDHTEEDYRDLLELPKKLGRLAVADRTGTVYRAPLWELSKQQVFDMIPPELRPFVIHTGQAKVFRGLGDDSKIVYNITEAKRIEWHASKMKDELCGEHWEYKLSEIPLRYRLLAGEVTAADIKLPPEADQFAMDVAQGYGLRVSPGPTKDLHEVENQFLNWTRCLVDMINAKGIKYPTKEEEALALVKKELKAYTPRKVEVREKDDKVFILVGDTIVETADAELIEEARAYQKKQLEEKLREQVEVLQDGSDEPACALVNEVDEVNPVHLLEEIKLPAQGRDFCG